MPRMKTYAPAKNHVPAIALDSFQTTLFIAHERSGELPLSAVQLLLAVDADSGEILETGLADGVFQSIGSADFYRKVMAYRPDTILRDHRSGTRGDALAMFEDCGQPLTRPIPKNVAAAIVRHSRRIAECLPYATVETPWCKAPAIVGINTITLGKVHQKLDSAMGWMRRRGNAQKGEYETYKSDTPFVLAVAEMEKQIKRALKGPYLISALNSLNDIHSCAQDFRCPLCADDRVEAVL